MVAHARDAALGFKEAEGGRAKGVRAEKNSYKPQAEKKAPSSKLKAINRKTENKGRGVKGEGSSLRLTLGKKILGNNILFSSPAPLKVKKRL